jgi:hypothetical protein
MSVPPETQVGLSECEQDMWQRIILLSEEREGASTVDLFVSFPGLSGDNGMI